jgi:hypothetical protein
MPFSWYGRLRRSRLWRSPSSDTENLLVFEKETWTGTWTFPPFWHVRLEQQPVAAFEWVAEPM